MKKTYWLFLILSFNYLQSNTHEFQTLDIRESKLLKESRIEITGETNQKLDQYKSKSKDKFESQFQSNELSRDPIDSFWNTSNGIFKFRKPYLESHNPILLINLFERIGLMKSKRDIYKQIAFFEILYQLSNIFKPPFKVVDLIWVQSLKMRDIANSHSHKTSDQVWWFELNIIMRFYETQMIENISLLQSDKDLTEFVMMQREFGDYGVNLTENWSLEDQKDLFKLWISGRMKLYLKLKWNPNLQNVIETQVVQKSLIESFQRLPFKKLQIGLVYLERLSSTLITHSRKVVEYINTLRHGITMKDFISWKILINPYGSKISESLEINDQINIIKFWSTYVDILTMRIPEEENNLKSVIET
ncbi:hypothetical protein DFH28DRAFT_1110186 [Melampsora americana]|nr:hypothetical protein DFH28DRAFT_1110186 [Melampsora americana]